MLEPKYPGGPHILVVLGGDAPGVAFFRRLCDEADALVCADGGLTLCDRAGVTPQMLVGDMDSISPEVLARFRQQGGQTRLLPTHKDDTDGFAALQAALKQKPRKITLVGGLGGRFDHALGNCYLLVAALEAGVEAVMESEQERLLALKGPSRIPGRKGELLSLLPLGEALVSGSRGLHYPLDPLVLRCNEPRGISNVFTEDEAYLNVEQGLVLAVLNHDLSLAHL